MICLFEWLQCGTDKAQAAQQLQSASSQATDLATRLTAATMEVRRLRDVVQQPGQHQEELQAELQAASARRTKALQAIDQAQAKVSSLLC